MDNADTLRGMTGFIGVPTLRDIQLLQQHIVSIEKRLAKLEAAGKQADTTKPARTRGTRLPQLWVPTTETVEKMCAELNVTSEPLIREHRKFCDWAYSASGPNAVKKDWDRAWCNWMRRAYEDGKLYGVQVQPRTNDDKAQGWMELGHGEG